MKTQITINVKDGLIEVYSPYSPDNNVEFRSLGGKFASDHWVIRDTPEARKTLAELFGAQSELVEVLVPASLLSDGPIVQHGGYVLASRRFRDGRVNMPDGVSLAAGSFGASGGSHKIS